MLVFGLRVSGKVQGFRIQCSRLRDLGFVVLGIRWEKAMK